MLREACHGVKFHVERHVAHDLMAAETVGQRIAARRREIPKYARDQGRLAEDVGVARGTISAWENDRFVPEGTNLQRLAECLSVSRGWILDGDRMVVREATDAPYSPSPPAPDPHGSAAEQLLAYLETRVGYRRLAGELTSKDLIAAAYTLAREDRLGPDEFAKLDRWRDQILAEERSASS